MTWKAHKKNLLTIWPIMNPDIKLFEYLFIINPYFSRLSDKTPATKKLNNLSCGYYTQLKSLFVTEFMFSLKLINSICYSLIAMVLDPLTFPNFCLWLRKFKKVLLITCFHDSWIYGFFHKIFSVLFIILQDRSFLLSWKMPI